MLLILVDITQFFEYVDAEGIKLNTALSCQEMCLYITRPLLSGVVIVSCLPIQYMTQVLFCTNFPAATLSCGIPVLQSCCASGATCCPNCL